MLQDDFEKLIALFQTADPKSIDLEKVMQDSAQFFEKLKSEVQEASPEERDALLKNLTQMYTRLIEATQQMATRLGVSEDELMSMGDHLENLPPKQRAVVERIKTQLAGKAEEVAEELHDEEKPALHPSPAVAKKQKRGPSGRGSNNMRA